MSFVHLHVHSSYSVLDGFGSPADLVARAKELAMPAIALTDHGTMFGVLDFYKAATAAGVKPIIGLETYVAPRSMRDRDVQWDKRPFHLVLLAENMVGYHNLLKIASASQLEGFYYHPRVDKEFLSQHHEGLIASSACLSGEIPRSLIENDAEKAERKLAWYLEVFGQENFFLELQDHALPDLPRVNRGLIELAGRTGAQLIATNDVHYVRQEDAELQDILLCVQTGKLLSDKNRMKMSDDSYYLRSPQEMQQLFKEVPQAISNTLAIAERCQVNLTRRGYHLPQFELPEGENSSQYLRELCQEGLKRRMPASAGSEEVQKRLDYELGVINQMGFAEYFLIVWDLCRFSRDQNIWYNVRGSGNGSLVAYALDITMVNPLEHQLLFERFLNPDRVTMPDIDLDYQDDRRAEVMEYCNQKYGADKVAQIITFGTMAARGAIRDVGRVMNIPLSEVDRVAKLVPPPVQGKAVPITDSLQTTPELKAIYDSSEDMKKLIDTASRMEGSLRNVGTHAAGVIISDKPLTEYLPLHRPTNQNEDLPIKSVAQYDMDGINQLGLLKVDFLGLVTLTIMAKACEYIEKRHGVKLTLSSIPIDDPAVYRFISEGHTIGLFQLEGNGMTRYIMQMQPTTVKHVIAMTALFRPGPMEIIPEYIANMHGTKPVVYQHEKLKPILEETYGHAVYQEQIMMAARQLAGYTPGESDDLRSAISKKKVKEVKKHHDKFVKGAVANGISEKTAEEIFAHWEAFAHYGFNKSHATNYGMIAVKTAYLKLHYTVEYMTALLSAWKNDNEKTATYVSECRAMGVQVLPPDVNMSGYDFSIEDRPDGKTAIRFGLGAVKNVGQGPVDMIIRARGERPFSDITDFARRTDLRAVGKRALECLIKVGALESLGERSALLRVLDQMINVSASHFKAAEMGQLDLFGGGAETGGVITLSKIAAQDANEALEWEKDLLGLYVSENPLSAVMSLIADQISHLSNSLSEVEQNGKVKVGGMVKRMRPLLTKNNKSMGFVTIEDHFGEIDLVVFPSAWERFNSILEVGALLVVNGKVDHKENGVAILVDSLTRINQDERGAEPNHQNQGPFYDQVLEKYLPDIRILSRYAYPNPGEVANSEQPEVPEDATLREVEEAEGPEWSLDEGDAFPTFSNEEMPDHEFFSDVTADLSESDFSQASEPPQSTFEPEAFTDEAIETRESEHPTTEKESFEEKTFQAEQKHAQTGNSSSSENTPRAHKLVVSIKICGELDKDLRRIRHIHGLLSSHPGDFHFAFSVAESGQTYEIDFPNDSTDLNDALVEDLSRLVGKDNFTVNQ